MDKRKEKSGLGEENGMMKENLLTKNDNFCNERETQIYVILYVQRFSRTYRHVCLVHNSAQNTHTYTLMEKEGSSQKITHKQIKAHTHTKNVMIRRTFSLVCAERERERCDVCQQQILLIFYSQYVNISCGV